MTETAPDTSGKTPYFLYNPDSERDPSDWRVHKATPPVARMVQLHLDGDESAALDADIDRRGEAAVATDVLRRIARDHLDPG